METSKHRSSCAAVLFCLGLTSFTVSTSAAPAKAVRFVYLVSSDREINKSYEEAIENAAVKMQRWYARELHGKTFKLYDPVVEIVKSDKPALWFATHPNLGNKAFAGFWNTLDEMMRLRNVNPTRDGFVWVVYSDGPGNNGCANPGFAYLPEDDLLGLIGAHPVQKNPKRWVMGMGHELGHALGLPHPTDTTKFYNALMWAGFYQPERAYLTQQDKEILLADTYLKLVVEADKDRTEFVSQSRCGLLCFRLCKECL